MEKDMSGADILWLALCIFYEARGEPFYGQIGVAHVVVNRSIERQISIEEVVKEPDQFSWYNEGTMVTTVLGNLKAFFDCVNVVYKCAEQRQKGITFDRANHFYNPDAVSPSWADDMTEVAVIGNHRFLRG